MTRSVCPVMCAAVFAACAQRPAPSSQPADAATCALLDAQQPGRRDAATSRSDGAEAPRRTAAALAEACDPAEVATEAFVAAGQLDERTAVLPNGRRVRPAGDIIPLADRAMGLAIHPSGRHAYVVHSESKSTWDGIWVVDLSTLEVVQKLAGYQAYHGISVSADGRVLALAGLASGQVHRFSIGADGRLSDLGSVDVGVSLVDVALTADGATVWALSNTNSRVYAVDMVTGAVRERLRAGTNPHSIVLDEANHRAYASNLSSGTVAVMDTDSDETLAYVEVGKNPEGLALDAAAGRLYVANSDSDTISVIDTDALEVVATWDLTGNERRLTGGALNTLWLDAAGGRLYAAMARRNAALVIDLADGAVVGAVPTGHYPVDLALTPDRGRLVSLSAKGFGSSKTQLKTTPGQLNVVDRPVTDEALAALTAEVAENNLGPAGWYPAVCAGDNLPPALRGGPDKPIEHVVLIVKENKTYDVVLGDDPSIGDGDPELCLFPEPVTPNMHRLARDFVNLDNFYADAEVSIQGHLWTTMADCNDYAEKVHESAFALYGYEPATIVEGGTIFDHCFTHGVSFRNYGEAPGFMHRLTGDFEAFIDHKYPFWSMAVPDVDKAQEFIRELEQGIFPEFVYIVLPNDHTYGGRAGAPDPTWMVADNDAGLGMIVEAISRSPYWPSTAIFVLMDDPQGPPDHVHSHRSPCVVISPHVKRGYTSSVHYSIPSVYATIERILELPPLNRNTLEAPPMIDVFLGDDDTPDFTPHAALANAIPYAENQAGTRAAKMSAQLDFSTPDRAEGVGKILWYMIKGDKPMPPYARYSDE